MQNVVEHCIFLTTGSSAGVVNGDWPGCIEGAHTFCCVTLEPGHVDCSLMWSPSGSPKGSPPRVRRRHCPPHRHSASEGTRGGPRARPCGRSTHRRIDHRRRMLRHLRGTCRDHPMQRHLLARSRQRLWSLVGILRLIRPCPFACLPARLRAFPAPPARLPSCLSADGHDGRGPVFADAYPRGDDRGSDARRRRARACPRCRHGHSVGERPCSCKAGRRARSSCDRGGSAVLSVVSSVFVHCALRSRATPLRPQAHPLALPCPPLAQIVAVRAA